MKFKLFILNMVSYGSLLFRLSLDNPIQILFVIVIVLLGANIIIESVPYNDNSITSWRIIDENKYTFCVLNLKDYYIIQSNLNSLR